MKYLFEYWKEIEARIQNVKNLFLLLDYDGTLTPIASRPELALCPFEVKKHLETLRDLPGVHIAIISGRSLEDVRERVGISGIIYVGNHGLEIESPGVRNKIILASGRRRELKRIAHRLQNSLKETPGILFEEKGPVLSVHYRNVPKEFFTQVRQAVEAELRRRRDRWKMASGKMVLEIRPQMDFNKGKAVRELIKAFPSRDLLPICLGDDLTDEDAFRVVKKQGVSVYVGIGSGCLEADFFLQNPNEVKEFLFRCQEMRRSGRHWPEKLA